MREAESRYKAPGTQLMLASAVSASLSNKAIMQKFGIGTPKRPVSLVQPLYIIAFKLFLITHDDKPSISANLW